MIGRVSFATVAFLVQEYEDWWRTGTPCPPADPRTDTPASILFELCRRCWCGEVLDRRSRRFLATVTVRTGTWARRLVIGMAAADAYLRANQLIVAARLLARCSEAHRELCRLGPHDRHVVLRDYRAACARILLLLEAPPVPEERAPTALARITKRLPRPAKTRHPDRALDALDAVITAGHSGTGFEIEGRVVRELARLVNGWVLFHYVDGVYVTLRPQAEHTLTTWTIHQLVGEETIRARKIRKKPEFWRPDQRRPRGVLTFPLGRGTACIAARRAFTTKELRAVRTVLRFFESRRLDGHGKPLLSHHTHISSGRVRALAGEGLIGRSRPWREVLELVGRVAPSRCSVVLQGETGTGKERLARAVHSASSRSQGPFVAVNCGAVPEALMASELFGHVRGAFTGADRNRTGLIARAHRGTLFLDEIADMPPSMQVALLRVLEERQLNAVGGTRPKPVNVRVLCASHRDLEAEVAGGRFREDLYHRLSVVTIRLPPLRERGEDQLLLAQHLLRKLSPQRSLHADALPVLLSYGWPGNVRELDNVLQAAALLCDDVEIPPETLERLLAERRRHAPPAPSPAMGPRTQRILDLTAQRWLSASTLAQELGVSTRTVNRELHALAQRGLMTHHGEGRARVYRRRNPA